MERKDFYKKVLFIEKGEEVITGKDDLEIDKIDLEELEREIEEVKRVEEQARKRPSSLSIVKKDATNFVNEH